MKRSQPVHVICRVAPDVMRKSGGLRKREMYAAIREATIVVTKYADEFRIVHLSIQGMHLHLIVEADSRAAMWSGMRSLLGSAARQINRSFRERTGTKRIGKVFTDRYQARVLTTPREVRHVLCYVLNNWRRHEEDRRAQAKRWQIDPFSSAMAFDGWKEGDVEWPLREAPTLQTSIITWPPRSWLLRVGWRRHGLISCYEVPGPARS